jgi:hypothetical protein
MLEPAVPPDSVGILVPTGMLGAGFDPEIISRGLSLGADVIAVDGGSTDSGPYYLGTGQAKTADDAVRRDLRVLLAAVGEARIPLVVGSCGTGGTDSGVRRSTANSGPVTSCPCCVTGASIRSRPAARSTPWPWSGARTSSA